MNAGDSPSVEESSFAQRVDWDVLLILFKNAISDGNEEQQLFATKSLRRLCSFTPDHVIKQAILILVDRIESSPPSVQISIVGCLNIFARFNDESVRAAVGEAGGIAALLRLLYPKPCKNHTLFAKCLSNLLEFEHQNQVAFSRIGGLMVVLNLIRRSSEGMKGSFLEILSAALLLKDARRELVRCDGVSSLIQALSRGSMASRARAAHVIGLITTSRGARPLLVDSGALPALVDLMRTGDLNAKLIAANSLGLVSSHHDYLRLVVEEGAIPLYAELLEGDNDTGKGIVENVFCILSVDERNCVQICRQLMRILQGNNEEAKSAAVDVLWELLCHEHANAVLIEIGAIRPLLELTQEGDEDAAEGALAVLVQMTYEEAERLALADQGAIPVLARLLSCPLEDIQNYAVEALVNFSEDPDLCHRVSHLLDDELFQTLRRRLAELQDNDDRRYDSEEEPLSPNRLPANYVLNLKEFNTCFV